MSTYKELIEELKASSEGTKFIEFSSTILKSNLTLIGVKTPTIKRIIKKYSNCNLEGFIPNEYYETNLIYLCLGFSKQKNLNEIFNFIVTSRKLVDSWALTDTSYKYAKLPKSLKEALPLIDQLINYDDEFVIRYGYLFMFNYLKEKDNLPLLFSRFHNTNLFYVLMVEAWVISYLFVNFFDETYDFIKNSDLSLGIKLKSISKAIDSFRINDENKSRLRELRKILR